MVILVYCFYWHAYSVLIQTCLVFIYCFYCCGHSVWFCLLFLLFMLVQFLFSLVWFYLLFLLLWSFGPFLLVYLLIQLVSNPEWFCLLFLLACLFSSYLVSFGFNYWFYCCGHSVWFCLLFLLVYLFIQFVSNLVWFYWHPYSVLIQSRLVLLTILLLWSVSLVLFTVSIGTPIQFLSCAVLFPVSDKYTHSSERALIHTDTRTVNTVNTV